MHDSARPLRKISQQTIINRELAGANLRPQQLLGSKNAPGKRGDVRIGNNHLRGKLNVEDRPDGLCDALRLALGPETEIVLVVLEVSVHSR